MIHHSTVFSVSKKTNLTNKMWKHQINVQIQKNDFNFYVNISKIFKAFDRFTIICISKPYSEITSKKKTTKTWGKHTFWNPSSRSQITRCKNLFLLSEYLNKQWYSYLIWNCCCLVTTLVSDPLWPHELHTRLLCAWGFPGKITEVTCYFLLQGTCPTQGWNLHFLLGKQILYHWATWKAPFLH